MVIRYRPQLTSSTRAPDTGAGTPRSTSGRDIRLDFFRGLAMLFILVAHIPSNKVANYLPGRFGISDSAEIFVFCSGIASAIAFGTVFQTRGWWMGVARIAQRVWQVYWAHIGLFLAVAVTMAAIDQSGIFARYGAFEKTYVTSMGIPPFFDNTRTALVGLLTLTYVPNYFDILPMYLVILALVPVMILLARVSPWLAIGASVALWFAAQLGLALPASPWHAREWFFNPFAWQIVFFTGFALRLGWLPRPPVKTALVVAAVAVLVTGVPLGRWQIWTAIPWLDALRDSYFFLLTKTDQGLLRFAHFLALAYVAWLLAGAGGVRLRALSDRPATRTAAAVILTVGRQALPVFIFTMWLAQVLGFCLDFTAERGWAPTIAANLVGLSLTIGLAYMVTWFKSEPWRRSAP